MPKILHNTRQRLIDEAKSQILNNGYSAVTVRTIASACGVSVGSFYNCFKTKESLVAVFLLEDWAKCIDRIRAACLSPKDPISALAEGFAAIRDYSNQYSRLFGTSGNMKTAAGEFYARRARLRNDIADALRGLCTMSEYDGAFLPDFLAENLLVWASEGRDFDSLRILIAPLFDNNIKTGDKL